MILSKKTFNKYNKNISYNVKLSNYSWFNLGGPAEYLFKPENKDQLIDFLQKNKSKNFQVTILGAGSNTLIRDKGVKGVVVKAWFKLFRDKALKNNTIEVELQPVIVSLKFCKRS